jgi:hypothetical protein
VVPLRPLGIGELLDGSIKIMRRNPRTAYGVSAAISAVVTILNVVVVLLFAHVPSSTDVSTTSFGDAFSSTSAGDAATLPDYALRLLAGLVLSGVLVTVVSRAMLGRLTSLDDVREAMRGRVWPLLGLGLLSLLVLVSPLVVAVVAAVLTGGIGALLLIVAVPAFVYLWVRLSLAPSVLLLERSTIRTALRRSGTLMAGAWWRCFGVLVLALVISSVLASILAVPLGVVVGIIGEDRLGVGALVAIQVMAGLAQVVVAPFTAGVKSLLYIDQRMRLEGLDVALQSARATRVPAASR